MDNADSNPFRFLDKKWTRLVLPWVLLALLGFLLVISILDPIIPYVHRIAEERNLYVVGIFAIIVIATPLLFNWLSRFSLRPVTTEVVLGSVEEQSIRQLLSMVDPPYGDVDICAYTGPTIVDALSAAQLRDKVFGTVRILLRHPGVSFSVPSDPARAEAMRQRIRTDVDHFQLILSKAAANFEIRGYADEPSLRSVTVGKRAGLFNLYTTSIRLTEGHYTRDFVSRGKPTLVFNSGSALGNHMLANITERFNDIWQLSCPMLPKPALLFDFDGTLFDSLEAHKEAWRRTLVANGVEAAVGEELDRLIESGIPAPAVAERLGLPVERIDVLVSHKRKNYSEILASGRYRLYDDVRETVTFLKRKGYELGIATNASRTIVETVLANAGIQGAFSALVCLEETSRPKPDPQVINAACSALNIEPRRTIFIGDSIADQEAATQVGVTFILLIRVHTLKGYRRYPHQRPFLVIFSLADLKDFLI